MVVGVVSHIALDMLCVRPAAGLRGCVASTPGTLTPSFTSSASAATTNET